MPLRKLKARVKVTADLNDIFSSHQAVKNARGNAWRIFVWCTAANDATITINDGEADIVSAEALATVAAGSTGPICDYAQAQMYEILTKNNEVPTIDIIDGTSAEIVVELARA